MKKLFQLLIVISVISVGLFSPGCEQLTDPFESTSINGAEQVLNKDYQTRPFSGYIVYTFISQVNDSVQIYQATGTGTHFGHCTVTDTTTHHYTQTGLTVVGSDWITVASGALVHMNWFMDYYDPDTWVWEFKGGTGRFEGLTGGGPFTAGYTPTGDLWVNFTGTITY